MLVGICWICLEGGMFIWVDLLEGMDVVVVLKVVVEMVKVVFVFGKVFYVDGSGVNILWLSFFCVLLEDIEVGIFCLGVLFV